MTNDQFQSFGEWVVAMLKYIAVILAFGSAIQLLLYLFGEYQPSGWIYVIACTIPLLLAVAVGTVGKLMVVLINQWDSPSSPKRVLARSVLSTVSIVSILAILNYCSPTDFVGGECRYEPERCIDE